MGELKVMEQKLIKRTLFEQLPQSISCSSVSARSLTCSSWLQYIFHLNFVRKLTFTTSEKEEMSIVFLEGAKALLNQSVERKVKFDQSLVLFQILNKASEEMAIRFLGFSSPASNMIIGIQCETSTCANLAQLMC